MRDAGFSPPEYQGTALVHAVGRATDKLGRSGAGGREVGWARFMGRFKLAPWLIGRSLAEGGNDLQPRRLDRRLFQCPACGGDVADPDQASNAPPVIAATRSTTASISGSRDAIG